jgi:phosphate transport system substrate-binding protein
MSSILHNIKRSALVAVGSAAVAALAAAPALAQSSPMEVDPELPSYEPASGISGTFNSVGSDTLNNMMALWTEKFTEFYPNVQPEVVGKGSSTAPPALIEGTSDVGPMSRAMKDSEVDKFKTAFGYEPTPIRVAVDALGVFVHKDNPVESLSLDQLQQIYSIDGPTGITWGDVGVTDPAFRDQPITLYGRNSASGTYGYFKKNAMGDVDYKSNVKEQPGSSGVVQGVGSDRFGIGYSGVGYKTADTKLVPLSDGGDAFPPSAEAAYAGDYPLARFLYVYANVPPNQSATPIVKEFLTMVLSKEGQEAVIEDGYFPISAELSEEEIAKLSGN